MARSVGHWISMHILYFNWRTESSGLDRYIANYFHVRWVFVNNCRRSYSFRRTWYCIRQVINGFGTPNQVIIFAMRRQKSYSHFTTSLLEAKDTGV